MRWIIIIETQNPACTSTVGLVVVVLVVVKDESVDLIKVDVFKLTLEN